MFVYFICSDNDLSVVHLWYRTAKKLCYVTRNMKQSNEKNSKKKQYHGFVTIAKLMLLVKQGRGYKMKYQVTWTFNILWYTFMLKISLLGNSFMDYIFTNFYAELCKFARTKCTFFTFSVVQEFIYDNIIITIIVTAIFQFSTIMFVILRRIIIIVGSNLWQFLDPSVELEGRNDPSQLDGDDTSKIHTKHFRVSKLLDTVSSQWKWTNLNCTNVLFHDSQWVKTKILELNGF